MSINENNLNVAGNKQLVYIDIDQLYQHPDNPRKDLGELTELADSIRAQGVMQNLTVVPREAGGYTLIIGHRRCAASKLAGLTELPCVITELSEKEQAGVMLLENMQRNDLTLYEQAKGFQLTLDLGYSVNELSQKTGFSQTTINRRVKLLEFDEHEFKQSQGMVTLMEYMEIAKIRSESSRSYILSLAGTPSFQGQLKNKLKAQSQEDELAKVREKLEEMAEFVETVDRSLWKHHSYIYNDDDLEKVTLEIGEEYCFTKSYYSFTLYCKKTKEEIGEFGKSTQLQEEQSERREALKNLDSQLKRDRITFIRNVDAKRYLDVISKINMWLVVESRCCISHWRLERQLCSLACVFEFKDFSEKVIKMENEQLLLFTAWAWLESVIEDNNSYCYEYSCKYKRDKDIERMYRYLRAMGYKKSVDEIDYISGAHELFAKVE